MSTLPDRLIAKKTAPVAAISLVAVPLAPASTPAPDPSSAKAAIKRCCTAWQRAVKAYTREFGSEGASYLYAKEEGIKAYRNAMPVLSGIEGIRDFLACAAHGILIDAIPAEKSGQLLYAAQVALNALHFESKPPKLPSK